MTIERWVILGMALVIIGLILFQPKNPDFEFQKKAYETEIAILKADRLEESKVFKAIVKKSDERIQKDSIALNAKDKRIQALEVKARVARTPKVDTLILNNSDLESFVNTQSEIISELKEEVDTLKAARDFHIQVNKDLVQSHEAEASISQRIEKEQDERIAKLEKEVKKKTRGNRWLKAGIVGAAVGGLFLGSQF